ncbi:MAG: ribulose-phosphate 3-epimerase, partial [Candidatus Omnitrophota bacterium]
NLTIGPAVVRSIRKVTRLPLDVHLMIERPEKFVDSFVKAGSDMITVHIEAVSRSTLKALKNKLNKEGVRLGVSLNPQTSFLRIKDVLEFADFFLVMSVNPGFGGQKFIPAVLPKIKRLRSEFRGDIAVDGGVNDKVAGGLIRAGANILAAGSYIFGAKDRKQAIERIRNAS